MVTSFLHGGFYPFVICHFYFTFLLDIFDVYMFLFLYDRTLDMGRKKVADHIVFKFMFWLQGAPDLSM